MTESTFDRVAQRAATVKPIKLALSVIAFPFYALGLVFGVLWLAVAWAYAAVLVGVSDARARVADSRHRDAVVGDDGVS